VWAYQALLSARTHRHCVCEHVCVRVYVCLHWLCKGLEECSSCAVWQRSSLSDHNCLTAPYHLSPFHVAIGYRCLSPRLLTASEELPCPLNCIVTFQPATNLIWRLPAFLAHAHMLKDRCCVCHTFYTVTRIHRTKAFLT
jgi:hypothetical protein